MRFIQRCEGALRAGDPKANRALRDMVAAAGQGEPTTARSGIVLMAKDGKRFTAHVLPLTSGRRRYIAQAAVVIFVSSTKIDLPPSVQTVSTQFNLTPGEMRVLFLIFELNGTLAVAQALGLSEATVKTHLRNIFRKTGTRNQVDLVKLVADHASPLG